MRRQLSRVCVLCMLCSSLLEAGGSILGRVATKEGESIVGAIVQVQGTVRGTTSGVSGEFRLGDLPAGMYGLVVSMVGYRRQVINDVVVVEGSETRVSIGMEQAIVQTEQVVVTASKREQSLQEVPVSMSLVEAAELRERNSLTIDDALRYVPGVNLTGTQINIRGSSGYSLGAGSRVLMLLDGVPFIAGDTGELIFESIPVGVIDRIEVVKGASSALYGSNALGGVINIITKAIPERLEASVRTYGGFYNSPSFDEWKWSDKTRFFNGQSVSLAQRFGLLGVSFLLARQIDDGYRQNDYRRRYNIYVKAREELSGSSQLTLNFGLLRQDAGQFLYWRSLDSALIPPRRHESDELDATRYYLNGMYSNAFTENFLFTAKAMWYHNNWGFQATGDPVRAASLTDGGRVEVSSVLMPARRHTMTMGLDGNVDVISGDLFERRTIGGLALYGQDEMKITDQLTVTLGIRGDFQSVGLSGEGMQLNPKLALAYSPGEGTRIRASFGRGFRVPSVTEAFIAAGSTGLLGVPNADLKPERSSSYELGCSQTLGDFGSLDAAVFRSDFDNLIEPGLYVVAQNLEVQWRNVTKARVDGFESLLKVAMFHGDVAASVGYTYVFPEDRTENDVLKYRPRHLFFANAQTRIGPLGAGLDFRYVSRVERIDLELIEAGLIPDGDERVDVFVVDARIGADFSLGGYSFTTTLNIRNLFQRNYVELIGNIMPPRTYALVLDVKL